MQLHEHQTEQELIDLARTLVQETGEYFGHREISLNSSLQYQLGLDSLGRAEIFRRIEKKWHVELPDRLLTEAETLGDLYAAIQTAKPSVQPSAGETTHRYEQYQKQKVADVSTAETLVEVLMEHAQKTPDRPYIYLQNENGSEEIMTYGDLFSHALQVADALKQLGLKPGETVAIMQPTQLGFFYTYFGVLLASAVPVPIYPPLRPQQIESYAKQEAKILHNAEIRFLVTFERAESLSRLLQTFVPSLQAVVTVNALLEKGKNKLLPLTAKKTDIALIQYTSGSTSAPKGVVLTHENLLANIRCFGQVIDIKPTDIAVSWLPLYHDFGLIGVVLGTLYYGIPLILFSPITFLSRPERWLWNIHYHRGTISAAPNFAFELCLKKIDEDALRGLDLSSWRIAANGAENIYPRTYERFVERYKNYGFDPKAFLPVYGLAESAVGLVVSPMNRLPRVDIVDRQALERDGKATPYTQPNDQVKYEIMSCGVPFPNHEVRIVDDQDHPLPERRVGHLQFKGPSSMQGYYNNPTATAAAKDGDWIRSGDFAYIADGEIFITGRQKDIIIKAGHNIYPTALEEVVAETPGIRRGCIIAFGTSDVEKGTEEIIIVAETHEKDPQRKEKIANHITEALLDAFDIAPDHVILVPPRSVPKTSSGKLQRAACKKMYLENKLITTPAWYQMTKLFGQSLWIKTKDAFKKGLKFCYTYYVTLLLDIGLVPAFLVALILPGVQTRQFIKYLLRALFFLAGTPIHLKDEKKFYQTKPVIYVANHASYIDALVAAAVLPADTFLVGKSELFKFRFLSYLFTKLLCLPIDRSDVAKGLEQTKYFETLLQEGQSLFIFPEGTFSYASGVRPFKLGAFKTAVETHTPICPFAIKGTRHIFRANSLLLQPGRIDVIATDPIQPEGHEWQDMMELKNLVREQIVNYCGELSLDYSSVIPIKKPDLELQEKS